MNKLIPLFLKFVGIGLTIIGIVGVYYGPLEIYVFYLFSQGGPFYYDGFGMGSLWFASLVVMNLFLKWFYPREKLHFSSR